jgi:hypothetical protein
MKLTLKVLAVAALSTLGSVSTFAQAPAVNNGSSWNRAPLPSNRPADFVRVVRLSANVVLPAQSTLIANHINGPVTNQVIAAVAPRQPVVASISR